MSLLADGRVVAQPCGESLEREKRKKKKNLRFCVGRDDRVKFVTELFCLCLVWECDAHPSSLPYVHVYMQSDGYRI